MRINWRIRFQNPTFWAAVAVSFFSPILVHSGANWADMTSWSALAGHVLGAFRSPVAVAAILVSLWNCINDPTTAGLSDSQRALHKQTYKE